MASKPPRALLQIIFKRIWKSLVKPHRHSVQVFKGEDTFGNKFYESKAEPKYGRNYPYRSYVAPNEEKWDQAFISAEWDAWLRGRRNDPPTLEELMKNEQIAAMKKINAAKLAAEAGKKSNDTVEGVNFPTYHDLDNIGRHKGYTKYDPFEDLHSSPHDETKANKK